MKSSALMSLLAVVALTSSGVALEPMKSLQDLDALQARVREVSEKVLPATVALLSERTGSSGSGIITTSDGLILTAAHVVQGADELSVVFPDGKQVVGKVLGANYSKDIGMVQIQEKGPWPFVARGQSKPLVAGDWVVALGHSAGFDPGRTPPVRFGRVVSKGPGNFFTTDCTLIGGDSGGPIFDLGGRIIGVNSSIGQSLKNNNHAGVDGFQEDWKRLIAGEQWGRLSMNPFANPEMPVLGIEMGEKQRVPGVQVAEIVPRSPAAAAGVRVGDTILEVDSIKVEEGRDLLVLLAKKKPGERIKLVIQRDRNKMPLEVTLASRESIFRIR